MLEPLKCLFLKKTAVWSMYVLPFKISIKFLKIIIAPTLFPTSFQSCRFYVRNQKSLSRFSQCILLSSIGNSCNLELLHISFTSGSTHLVFMSNKSLILKDTSNTLVLFPNFQIIRLCIDTFQSSLWKWLQSYL